MLKRLLVAAAFGTATAAAAVQDTGGQPDWIEQARLVAAKEGITVGEAVRRARLSQKVQRAHERFYNDPDYAGAVVRQDARGFRATFAFKGGRQPDLADPELRDNSEVVSAPRSLSDLRNARATLGRQLRSQGISVAFTEDIETQSMKLFPNDPVKFQQAVRDAGISIPDFVEVQTSPLAITLEYDVYGSGDISYSGSTDNCTGGFNVTNGTIRGLSTAGHCSIPTPASTHRGQPIGVLQPQISQLHDGNGLDVSWYRNSAHNYPNRVRIDSTSYYSVTVALAAPPAKLKTTCVLPRAAPQQCTRVLEYAYWETGTTGQYTDGPYIMTEHYLTARKDSGAPWLYGGEAHGIHLGSTAYLGYTRSVFSPVSSLPRIGLNVVTTP